MLDGPAVSQDVIDAAVSELQAAFDAAKAVLEVPSGDPGTPSDPSDNTGNDGQTPGTGSDQNQSSGQDANHTTGGTTSAKDADTVDNSPIAVCVAALAAAAAVFAAACRRKRER